MFYPLLNSSFKLPFLIICSYIFFAFLPMPSGVSIGLDPSWRYAISHAASEKLVFGKDIIFTYGPLGYLIHGSVLGQNFYIILLFRLIIELITFCISIITIVIQKPKSHKILLSASIFFSYLLGFFIEYKIVIAFIMIVSWDNIISQKHIRLWALGLGVISGLCLLTKFNIGICTLAITIIVILAEIFKDFQNKLDVRTSLFALSDAMLASLTSCFLFLNPNLAGNFKQVFLCLFYASFLGILAWFIKLKILEKYNYYDLGDINRITKKLSSIITFRNVFYLTYIFGIFTITLYSSPLLINYLKGSLEISSGYSSAMSIVGSPWELGFGIIGFILVFLISIQLIQEGFLGLGLASAFILWMSFKHGYVRQDGHVYFFLQCMPVILSVAIIKLKNRFNLLKTIVSIYLCTIVSIYSLTPAPFNNQGMDVDGKIKMLSPVNVINNVSALINPEKLRLNIGKNSNLELSKLRLPDKTLQVLKNQTIDVIPWEISTIESNKLNWKPRPIFQSYSAYTKFLDSANLSSMSNNPPDYILYNFNAIDGRHPFFDEPSTFSYIACHYKLSPDVNEFINTPALKNSMLLQKRPKSICSSSIETKQLALTWNQFAKIDRTFPLVRASIKFEYSLFGKLYKTLFRAPPVSMTLVYRDASRHDFRIIPENSENGIIISNLPLDNSGAFSFFKGDWNQQVKSFKFSTKNPILYKKDIEVNFNSYQLLDSSVVVTQDSSVEVSTLKKITFIKKPTEEYVGSLDSQPNGFMRGKMINLNGWVILKSDPQKVVQILVTHGTENTPIVLTQTNLDRHDVSKFYKNKKYDRSGWSTSFSLDELSGNPHLIKIWIYDPVHKTARQIAGKYNLEIHQTN